VGASLFDEIPRLAISGDRTAPTQPPSRTPGEEAGAPASPSRASEAADPSTLTVAAQAAPPASAPTTPAFTLIVDGRVFTRSFSYVQNLTGLPDYRLPASFAAAFDLTVHPGALVSRRLAPLGLTGGFEYAPGIRSRPAGGDPVSTRIHGHRLGLEYLVSWPTLGLAPQLAYAEQVFQTGAARAPDVRYRLLDAGVDGRWEPGPRISVSLRTAYLHALSVGPLGAENAFPHVTAQGLLAEAAVGYEVLPAVEVRVTMGLRQMGLAMHTRPGERWIAGGATDQVGWLGLGMAYRPRGAR
jgi:hypothetical protein